jgi:hypothetical protein
MKKIAEALAGLLIAAGAAAAWRYWQIDGLLAVLIVLSGLSLTAHAFGYPRE